MDVVAKLGRSSLNYFRGMGAALIMLMQALVGKPQPRKSFPLFVHQMYVVGVQSMLIILISGLFIGMVLGLQGFTILVDFGAEQALGPMVALSLLRVLGPVVTALLFAGRAGSALTAEIGLMRATEQLSSLEMMAVDPLRRVVAPRFWAGLVSMPMLALMFTAIGIMGGYWVGVQWLGVDDGAFWSVMQSSVDWRGDVLNGVIKSLVFAFVVTWIALYKGYTAEPTSAGISKATTSTVVTGSLAVLGFDFVLTAIMFS